MPDLNTNPAGTSQATVRAQLITDAVIAAYIREISDSQPVHSHAPAPSPPTPAHEARRTRMTRRRRQPTCSPQSPERASMTRPRSLNL
jgi:hypothetical protein